jgi:hypothetical protein
MGSAFTKSALETPVLVEHGGTGLSTLTANSYYKGNGTGVPTARTYAEVRTDLNVADGANVNVYASVAEINTGTEAAKSVSPDALAGSNAGTRAFCIYAIEGATVITVGDGKAYARVPSILNGHDVVGVAATLIGHESTSGTPTIQIAIGRQANATTAHAYEDLLSTLITIDASEWDSKDATAAAVIDEAHHNILTGNLIRIDCDGAGTGAMGLIVTIETRLP